MYISKVPDTNYVLIIINNPKLKHTNPFSLRENFQNLKKKTLDGRHINININIITRQIMLIIATIRVRRNHIWKSRPKRNGKEKRFPHYTRAASKFSTMQKKKN